MLFIIYFNIKN